MPDDETIPIVEETAELAVRKVVTGRVRVETRTELVEEMVHAELATGEVEVVRVPVNRIVDQIPEARVEGDVTILPVVEEVLFVERRLVLKEEVRITRRATRDSVEIPVTLKKQKLTISRTENGQPAATNQGDDHD